MFEAYFISPEVIAWFFAPGNGDKEREHLSCVFCGTKSHVFHDLWRISQILQWYANIVDFPI